MMSTVSSNGTLFITYRRGSVTSTNGSITAGSITATEHPQWPYEPRRKSRYERELDERLDKFGRDSSKLLARLRQEEATRKAASDHQSRARVAHPSTRGWKGRQLQTAKAAMAAKQAVRFGP